MDEMHLSDSDTFTLHLERDPLMRSTIVAVVVLDRPPDQERLAAAVERATCLEPKFRRRLDGGAGPLVPARWVDDPDFDLSWHLRRIAVPAGGTFDDVLEFARIAGMTAFDPVHPRWEFTVVEGLPKGQAALVMKVHHALTDGIGGIQLAQHVVDLDRRGRRRPPIAEPAHGPDASLVERATDAVVHDAVRVEETAAGLLRAVPQALGVLIRRPFRIWEDLGDAAQSLVKFVRPITNTMSPVMVERRLGWRYHCFEVPYASLRAAAAKADGTLNDGFLGGIAGGLAIYHEEHGSHVSELRVTMPISTRHDGDGPGGNHVSLVRFPVPIGDYEPTARMMAIDHTTKRWRAEAAVGWTEAIAGALNLLPTGVASGMLKHVDVLASNVPGFDTNVFVAGSRVEAFYAFGPTMGAAANITLMSYCGQCFIGVTTDAGAVPDHEAFLACLKEGFAELVAVGAS